MSEELKAVLAEVEPLTRTLFAKRLFNLPEFGAYNNIEFSTAVTKIPEPLALNTKVIEYLYIQQLLGMEIAYRQYLEIHRATSKMEAKEALEFLKKHREQTWEELKKEMEGNFQETEEEEKENK